MGIRIDVIIPAFNASATLPRTLASIASQSIAADIDVTIVDDKSSEGYLDIIHDFSRYLSINILFLQENRGPGVARQHGIDKISNPYITFIDADDTFAGPFALQALRQALDGDVESHTVAGTFYEVHGEYGDKPTFMPHKQDTVWMFGKLYRRSFLDKYTIRFNPQMSRSNEDSGFNMLLRLCSGENEKLQFIDDEVYYWHENLNSITRKNNYDYRYNQSFVGYAANMTYAVENAMHRRPENVSMVKLWAVRILCVLYEYYVETLARAPQYAQQNLAAAVEYYQRIFSRFEADVTAQELSERYADVMRNAYGGNKLEGIIPAISFREFFRSLKEAERE